MAAPWLPYRELEGGLLSPKCDHYGDDHGANMHAILALSKQRIGATKKRRVDHMLPKELQTVATQLDPIQEVEENNATWRKCWRGLWRLFNTYWYKPREPICLDDEFFTP